MRALTTALVALPLGFAAFAQGEAHGQAPPTSAKVDTLPLTLISPDRYMLPAVLEPVRSVTLVAPAEGIVRSQDVKVGADARSSQEVAQLDKGEALARCKIAQAEVKEHQAALEAAQHAAKAAAGLGTAKSSVTQAEARLEAAQARVELAQGALDRCSLRAPFGGRVLASYVSDGQYVAKGAVIAELADVSSLRVLLPLARAGASAAGSVSVSVEGQPVQGKIQALIPLPDQFAALRELALPMTAAWVVVPNPTGALEPGQRVVSLALPATPIANVPAHAVQRADGKGGAPGLQVIRNEYVVNVPVRVLGHLGPDRLQITGALRPTDALIVSTSVPLMAGTLIRFGGGGGVEGVTPNPSVSGETAEVTLPGGAAPARGGPAPIGSPGSAAPKGKMQNTGRNAGSPASPPSVPF